jgi:hypothetical protein
MHKEVKGIRNGSFKDAKLPPWKTEKGTVVPMSDSAGVTYVNVSLGGELGQEFIPPQGDTELTWRIRAPNLQSEDDSVFYAVIIVFIGASEARTVNIFESATSKDWINKKVSIPAKPGSRWTMAIIRVTAPEPPTETKGKYAGLFGAIECTDFHMS